MKSLVKCARMGNYEEVERLKNDLLSAKSHLNYQDEVIIPNDQLCCQLCLTIVFCRMAILLCWQLLVEVIVVW